jgi:hypothetical protein
MGRKMGEKGEEMERTHREILLQGISKAMSVRDQDDYHLDYHGK